MGRPNVLHDGLLYYRKHSRYLLIVAAAYYGLILLAAAMAMVVGNADMQLAQFQAARAWVSLGFPGLIEAYLTDPLLAVAYTFLVNFFYGSVAMITLPGTLLFVLAPTQAFLRACWWGALFAPTAPILASALVWSLPTMILEGLGYILAVVPSTYLGLSWLSPKTAFREEGLARKEAFKRELVDSAKAYVWVALVLLIAAVVEVTTAQLRLHMALT
jgi:hypothetical protein